MNIETTIKMTLEDSEINALNTLKETYMQCRITEQFSCDKLNTFCGNIDEVNLRYVRDVLNKQHQKDKMCIVISDGATCGDWRDLRKVAENMEASGILMLGIGIFDNNVTKIYNNHIVLKESKDLEQLASFLNRYLVRHVFK
jgi:cobalamin biosynthesis protein CobT